METKKATKLLVFLGVAIWCTIVLSSCIVAKQEAVTKAAEAEATALHAKRAAEAEAKRKAMPPAEHLAAIKASFDEMKIEGYSSIKAGIVMGRAAYLPKGSREHAAAQAIGKQIEAMDRAEKAKAAATLAAAERKERAEWRKDGVQIGMTTERVRLSSWGRPNKINRSQYADRAEREQWVYDGGYLYFVDGILTGIQN